MLINQPPLPVVLEAMFVFAGTLASSLYATEGL